MSDGWHGEDVRVHEVEAAAKDFWNSLPKFQVWILEWFKLLVDWNVGIMARCTCAKELLIVYWRMKIELIGMNWTRCTGTGTISSRSAYRFYKIDAISSSWRNFIKFQRWPELWGTKRELLLLVFFTYTIIIFFELTLKISKWNECVVESVEAAKTGDNSIVKDLNGHWEQIAPISCICMNVIDPTPSIRS